MTCGEAEGGKLGLGDISNSVKTPTLVQGIPGKVVQVACGGAQTIAITGKNTRFFSDKAREYYWWVLQMKEKCLRLAMEQMVNSETEREFFLPTRHNQSAHSQTKSRSRRAARVTVLLFRVSIAFPSSLDQAVHMISCGLQRQESYTHLAMDDTENSHWVTKYLRISSNHV